MKTLRQLSLSDVFNSTNGGFDWCKADYLHICRNGAILYSTDECPSLIVFPEDAYGYRVATTIERDDDTRYVYANLQIETTPVDMRTMDEIMQEFLNEITKKEIPMTNKQDTYKISKAFTLDQLRHIDIKHTQGRAIGKSTAHHLGLISKAMKSPEQWIEITSDYDNLQRHHRWAFEEVRALCHKLGLDWMEFSVSGNSIRYMPYQIVKLVTKWERVE